MLRIGEMVEWRNGCCFVYIVVKKGLFEGNKRSNPRGNLKEVTLYRE